MLGGLQDTENDRDVMLNTEKFCGGSSGAAQAGIFVFIPQC